jgi:hypothetical protein
MTSHEWVVLPVALAVFLLILSRLFAPWIARGAFIPLGRSQRLPVTVALPVSPQLPLGDRSTTVWVGMDYPGRQVILVAPRALPIRGTIYLFSLIRIDFIAGTAPGYRARYLPIDAIGIVGAIAGAVALDQRISGMANVLFTLLLLFGAVIAAVISHIWATRTVEKIVARCECAQTP